MYLVAEGSKCKNSDHSINVFIEKYILDLVKNSQTLYNVEYSKFNISGIP